MFWTESVVSSDFPVFSTDTARLLPEFLGWFSKTQTFIDLCASASEGTTNRVRLKEPRFLAKPIPLPPLSEQRRVIERIDAIAAKLDEARQLRSETERCVRALLLSAHSEIIEGVALRQMAEIAPQIRRPVRPIVGEQYHELGVRSFGKGTFHKPAIDGMDVGTKKLYAIEPGDLVFNNVFAWEGAVAIAMPEDAGRVGSHRFITCVPQPDTMRAGFLNFHFSTQTGLSQLGDASPGGAGRNRTLGLASLNRIAVPVPSMARQNWFCQLLAKMSRTSVERLAADAEIDAMLPAILDRLFSAGAM